MGCTGSAAVTELVAKNDHDIITSARGSHNASYNASGDFQGKYILGKKLGVGNFAQVRICMRIDDPFSKQIAVKILDLRAPENWKNAYGKSESAREEERIWKMVGQHKNCVRLFEAFYGDGFCYMVMEKCSSKLPWYMYYMSDVNERTLGHLFAGMLQGLAHVHSVNVIHRDVKADNFLIGQDGCTVKLCDFGLSVKLHGSGKTSGSVGTAPYMCPEMLGGYKYGVKADVWSVGVIAYAFLFGDFPYAPEVRKATSMKTAILTGKTPEFKPIGGCALRTDTVVVFVKALLNRHPALRPTAEKALAMQFMEDVKENRHALSKELPSLRPMLLSAKQFGAFEDRNPSRCPKQVDHILDDLQTQRHGPKMSIVNSWGYPARATQSTTTVSSIHIHRTTTEPERKDSDISDDCSTSCTGSRRFVSLGTSAQGSEWSGENFHKWSVPSSPRDERISVGIYNHESSRRSIPI